MEKTSKRKEESNNTTSARPEALMLHTHSPLQSPQQRTIPQTTFILILIILAVSFTVYFNALFSGFVRDDIDAVVNNPWIRDSKYLTKIFTGDLFAFRDPRFQIKTNFYRPLVPFINMCSFHLFGLNPWAFHLVNVLFHAGNSLLVFMIASLLFREIYPPTSAPPSTLPAALSSPPFLAALLFATHPIHTEAVTWVSGLFDVSFTFFFFLSCWFYMRYKEGSRIRYLLLSLATFFASTLCKETALTLPLILIGYDYAFRKNEDHPATSVKRYIPYFVVAGIYMALRINAMKSFTPDTTADITEMYYKTLSTWQYVINVMPLFMEYLKDLFFPSNPNYFHTFYPIESLFNVNGMLSLAVTVVYLLIVFLAWKRNKTVFFGFLSIIVPLLPAFYIKALSGNAYAERYLYLPSFGFVVLLAVFFDVLNKKVARYSIVTMLIALTIVGLYSVRTITRNYIWKDDLTLLTDTVKKSPDAELPHRNLGVVFKNMGKDNEAIEQYQKSLELNPKDFVAHQYLADAYMEVGMADQGKKQYQKIINLNPDFLVKYNALSSHSNEELDLQKKILIKETLEQEINLQPNNAIYHCVLGIAYKALNMPDKAIQQYLITIKLKPDYVDAHYNLGLIYQNHNMPEKAVEQYLIVIKLKPDNASAYNNLGAIYQVHNMPEKAIEQYLIAIKLKPDYADPHFNLGLIYYNSGQTEEATREISAGLKIAPDNQQAQQLLNKISGFH